ncbi:hypothetical protein V2A60_004795 [Cordyceps javanica]|uniref:Acetyltransferase (GNAT) family domain-containing protein n=1 Tax=Cordyceps javanica TaxID=43265 RepID=A0A545WAI6_9HYPO|nr:acetyltransferase (GNAT) family domain-containing protein [Cordyceps javanica]TQW11001.1 acetyltransferase (GNAT) family domain-containing protein [Cordyceps javanica]
MSIFIRKAVEADIPAMAALDVAGYRHSAFRAAMFPPERRVRPGDGDALEWFERGARRALSSPCPMTHYIVAVAQGEVGDADGDGSQNRETTAVVGMAIWGSPRPDVDAATAVQGEEATRRSGGPPPGLPSYIGYEPVMAANEEIQTMLDAQDVLDKKTRSAMWNLDAVVVDQGHRRKGVGRALVQWGVDRAAEEGKGVWLIATSDGQRLYDAMGFSLVDSGARCGEAQHIMFRDLGHGGVAPPATDS